MTATTMRPRRPGKADRIERDRRALRRIRSRLARVDDLYSERTKIWHRLLREGVSRATIARDSGMTVGALGVALHKDKQRRSTARST